MIETSNYTRNTNLNYRLMFFYETLPIFERILYLWAIIKLIMKKLLFRIL